MLVAGFIAAQAVAAPGDVTATPYWRERSSFFHTYTRTADVVMVGDSLTDGAEWREMFPDQDIVNRGIDGDTTAGLLARLDDILRLAPKAVFVMIGINDFAESRRSVQAVVADYRTLVQRLAQGGARVYVQSTLPCNEALAAWKSCAVLNPKIRQLNAQLAHLDAAAVTYIDLVPALAGAGGLKRQYSIDGVHLNGDGYRAWRDAIAAFMPAPRPGRPP